MVVSTICNFFFFAGCSLSSQHFPLNNFLLKPDSCTPSNFMIFKLIFGWAQLYMQFFQKYCKTLHNCTPDLTRPASELVSGQTEKSFNYSYKLWEKLTQQNMFFQVLLACTVVSIKFKASWLLKGLCVWLNWLCHRAQEFFSGSRACK